MAGGGDQTADLAAGLGTRLRRLLAMVDGDVQHLYDEIGLPFRPRFYPVAALLLDTGAASVGEIGLAAGVSQPAATQTIGEMRRLGLVRAVAGTDRRCREVELTAEGRAVAARLVPVWRAIADAAARLDDELPGGLASALDAAAEALERRSFHARIRDSLADRKEDK